MVLRAVATGVFAVLGVALGAVGLGAPVPGVEATPLTGFWEGAFLAAGGTALLLVLQAAAESPSPVGALLLGVAAFVLMVTGSETGGVAFTSGAGLIAGLGGAAFLLGFVLSFTPLIRGDPAAAPSRTPLFLYLVAGSVVATGVLFVASALGSEAEVVRLSLDADWARVLYAAAGVVLVLRGSRALRRSITEGDLTRDELREQWREGRRKVWIFGGAGLLALLALLAGDAVPGIALERGDWFLWFFTAVCAFLVLAGLWNPEPTLDRIEKEERLEAGEGLRGRAEILDYDDTGTTINDDPRVRLRLRVEIEGREPVETSHTTLVPRLSVGRLLVGESLPVVADPENPEDVRVLWKEK